MQQSHENTIGATGGSRSDETRRKAGRGKPENPKGARRNASGRDEDPSHEGGPKNARTAGKDRDFDESGKGKNQAHGHPREERSDT